MARTALVVKTERKKKENARSLLNGKKPKFTTRLYNRCGICGRNKGYMNRFDMCRICVRQLARQGKLMGVTKSSW